MAYRNFFFAFSYRSGPRDLGPPTDQAFLRHACDKRPLEMKYSLNNDDMSKLAQPLRTLELVTGLKA